MRFIQNEDAFTGLEAAIVLIAFIVVAAVFSYVMLGAGFFATQEAQRVVHTGSQQASSSMEIIGNVYGVATSAGADNLAYIKFTVGTTAGGSPVDLTKVVVSYVDETNRWEDIAYEDGKESTFMDNLTNNNIKTWGIIEKFNANPDDLLEPGEQFVIGVSVPASAIPNTPFKVNLQPAIGAVYSIGKTVGPSIEKINILY